MKSTASELDWKSWVLFNLKIAFLFAVNPCHGRTEKEVKAKIRWKIYKLRALLTPDPFPSSRSFLPPVNRYHEKHFSLSLFLFVSNRKSKWTNGKREFHLNFVYFIWLKHIMYGKVILTTTTKFRAVSEGKNWLNTKLGNVCHEMCIYV